jgi:pimeloyl-ACP methyl ester carboxylesterase
LPGFGAPRPTGFASTKDAYARWLADALKQIAPPIDLVGHDLGALSSLRVATALDVNLRSFLVDVADIFHPDIVWPERVHQLQTPGVGERMMKIARGASPDDPQSAVARLVRVDLVSRSRRTNLLQ